MRKKRPVPRVLLLCLSVWMLLCAVPVRAEEAPEATDITRGFLFTHGTSEAGANYSHDRNPATYNTIGPDDVLRIRPRDKRQMGALYFRLGAEGAEMILRQYDREGTELLSSELTAKRLCFAVTLAADCWSVELTAKETPFRLCDLTVLSEGRFPEALPLPEAPVERTDFLIVTTHPDDEWIFLGAIYPIYGKERGLTGTFAYVTSPNIGRVHEAINSVWVAGMTTQPYFLGFPDVDRSAPNKLKDTFQAEEVTRSLVRLYRKIKPLVVVGQDPVNGEYGHWQHIITAQSTLEAAQLAPDPAYDPESAAEYGTWTVKKVYQHLAAENPITLDVTSPLTAYDGASALEVAKRAFDQHRSQRKYVFRPSIGKKSKGDIRYFGLTYTTVGPDTGNDMFEHIAEEDLAQVLSGAAPESTVSPTFTPAPTPDTAPDPTPAPTPEPAGTLAP